MINISILSSSLRMIRWNSPLWPSGIEASTPRTPSIIQIPHNIPYIANQPGGKSCKSILNCASQPRCWILLDYNWKYTIQFTCSGNRSSKRNKVFWSSISVSLFRSFLYHRRQVIKLCLDAFNCLHTGCKDQWILGGIAYNLQWWFSCTWLQMMYIANV